MILIDRCGKYGHKMRDGHESTDGANGAWNKQII